MLIQDQLRKTTGHPNLLNIQSQQMKNNGNVRNVQRSIYLQKDDVIHVANHDMLVLHPQLNLETHKMLKKNMIGHHRLLHIDHPMIIIKWNQRKKASILCQIVTSFDSKIKRLFLGISGNVSKVLSHYRSRVRNQIICGRVSKQDHDDNNIQ